MCVCMSVCVCVYVCVCLCVRVCVCVCVCVSVCACVCFCAFAFMMVSCYCFGFQSKRGAQVLVHVASTVCSAAMSCCTSLYSRAISRNSAGSASYSCGGVKGKGGEGKEEGKRRGGKDTTKPGESDCNAQEKTKDRHRQTDRHTDTHTDTRARASPDLHEAGQSGVLPPCACEGGVEVPSHALQLRNALARVRRVEDALDAQAQVIAHAPALHYEELCPRRLARGEGEVSVIGSWVCKWECVKE